MKRIAIITLHGHSELYPEIYEKIKEVAQKAEICNVKDKRYSDRFFITIYEDIEPYKYLMSIIEDNNIEYTFHEGREYTKKELNEAEFLDIGIVYPWEHDLKSSEDYGTQYDYENKCSFCGQGKRQISELIINTKMMKKIDLSIINPEIIVSSNLYNIIMQNNLSGCEFGDVKDYRGRQDEKFYQLKITNVLPPMDNRTKLDIKDKRFCYFCKKNGMYLESEIIYKSTDLKDAKDFNISDEYIGVANYCMQRIIVSKKFFEIYMKYKMKGINQAEPIKIIN